MIDFTPKEMSRRLGRIRAAMLEQNLGAFLSSDPAGIRYATGFRGEPGTLFLTQDEVVLYTSFRTESWARQQTRSLEISVCESPLDDALRRLPHMTFLGVDMRISHCRMSQFQQQFKEHSLIASNAIDQARQIKSEAEIEQHRRSQLLNEEVFSATLPLIKPGMTERTVPGLILSEIAKRDQLDGFSFPPIVAAGPNAWEIHHLPDATPLQKGDLLIIDLGVTSQGYASDMTRSVCLGEPTARMLEIHAIVSQAQDQAFQAIKSGVTNREVDRAAREVISQAGHGYGYTHGLGHSIGLETHDPGLNLSEKAPEQGLREGMALTIEPGIYLENEFGIRLEDTIIVRPDGYENLTRQDRAIHSI